MSQRHVEQVIGRLMTDEGFRRRFVKDAQTTLQELERWGVELTVCERQALGAIDSRLLTLVADAIDPRLQKTDLSGDAK